MSFIQKYTEKLLRFELFLSLIRRRFVVVHQRCSLRFFFDSGVCISGRMLRRRVLTGIHLTLSSKGKWELICFTQQMLQCKRGIFNIRHKMPYIKYCRRRYIFDVKSRFVKLVFVLLQCI